MAATSASLSTNCDLDAMLLQHPLEYMFPMNCDNERYAIATFAALDRRHLHLQAGEGLGRGECPPAADIHNPT